MSSFIPDGPPASSDPPYTCTFCGCLCDDVGLVAEGGVIVEVHRGCEAGRARLLGLAVVDDSNPSPRIDGKGANAEDALNAAARLLRGARAPLVLGFDASTNETVQQAAALADRLGALIEVGDARTSWPRITAMQRGGAVGATLGEVKNRADLVVFWGADPLTTHPRHWERYSVEPSGRFVPEGRGGRRVVVVDVGRTRTAEAADDFMEIRPECELNVLQVLRALLREARLDHRRVESATGCTLDDLNRLAETLRSARYGAWFTGPLLRGGAIEQAEARGHAVTGLVRELNRTTRFVALGLGGPGNAPGAEGVLAWQSGLTPGVDFGAGHPESRAWETTAEGRLDRGEFDCAVVVGGAALDRMTPERRLRLQSRPWVFLGAGGHEGATAASVAFPAATPGIDGSGTMTRVDGVCLPVRAAQKSRALSEGEWLAAIRRAVEALDPEPEVLGS